MSFLSRITSLFALKQKTAVKLIALMSVIAFVANLAPELYRDVPSQASGSSGDVTAAAPPSPPSAGPYIIVNAGGNSPTPSTSGCIEIPASTPYTDNINTGGTCHLDEAIMAVNNDTNNRTVTIIFSNAFFFSLFNDELTVNLPDINRPSGYPVVIDGAIGNDNGKISLADGTTSHNTLDHFFRIGKAQAAQNVTIKNIAFRSLTKLGSAAITTDNLSTVVKESGNIASINIENNYFGTTDGTTLNVANIITQPTKLYFADGTTPRVTIRNNNVYNALYGFELGASGIGGQNVDVSNCLGSVVNSVTDISNNIIGLNTNSAITDRNYTGQGSWSLFGIYACSMKGLSIKSNTIANSLGLLGMDKAIDVEFSKFTIQDNNIGAIKDTTDGHSITNPDWTIFGYGLYILGDPIGASRNNYISKNLFANIFIPLSPAVITAYCTGVYAANAAGDSCGGTAISLLDSNSNFIYNNTIGDAITPNIGYGIEIEGQMLGNTPSTTYVPSTQNKIFNNIIGYNMADGIHVGSIIPIGSNASLNQTCTTTIGVSDTDTNNCNNSILQNIMIRNGRFNQSDFCTAPTVCTGSHAGGIGIDLRASTDSTEQKYGDIAQPWTGSGTTNDTDISSNDGVTDPDVGGNGVLNTPVLYGTGSDLSGTGSTTRTIYGNLSQNVNGTYWVDVFAVNCPAEVGSTVPLINGTNAFTNCDTDSTGVSQQTYGQGFTFLCGALVTKTTSSSSWSCNPSDFGNTFPIGANAGGLITATATQFSASALTLLSSASASIRTNAGLTTGGGTTTVTIPGLDNTFRPRFTCQLIGLYITSSPSCSGHTGTYVPNTVPDSTINTVMAYASNTSEFSRNVFVAAPDVDITKSVRVCSGSAASNCIGNTFSSFVNRTPSQYVEFKIDLHNNSGSAINFNLNDDAPTGMTFVPTSCVYFTGLTTTPTDRPTGGTSCGTSSVSSTSIVLAPSSAIAGDGRMSVYVIAQVVPTAASGPHVNTARLYAPGTSCTSTDRCEASASVVVNINPTASLVKTIETPNTDSNLHTETLAAPTATSTINYQIKVDLTGVTKDTVSSLIITDNFPKTISGSQSVDYSSSGCQFVMQRNHGTSTTAQPCDNLTSINSTNTADLAVWHGSAIATGYPTFTPDDTFTITITYHSTIPANPLLSSEPAANIANVAKFVGTGFSTQTDTTTLVITPPSAQVNPVLPTIHKQVRACTGTTADTCTGAFNETGITNVTPGSTVEFRLEATSSSGATFNFKDAAPAGISFATASNSCLAYSNIDQLGGSAARPTSGGSACTIDSSTGTQLVTSPNVTIAANKYAYVYALATVATTATGTITNTASLNGNGCSASISGCSDPATVTVAATGQVTIDKQVSPSTVTSSPTTTTDVTYTIVITKPTTFAINNATWTDTFPTTPVALSNYTCTSIVVAPAGAQTIACPTTFPPAGGSLLPAGTTINQGVASITLTYTARVPVNAVTTTAQTVTNSTTIGGTRSTDSVAVTSTDTAVLTVNPNAGTSGGNTSTPVVTLTKRADNGVTTTDRSLEKIYKPGDTVNYTLSLLNSGATAATGVTLQDVFHSMLQTLAINALPAGATQALTSTTLSFGNITVPTGTTPTTVTYHGTIASKDTFDLDLFDLNSSSNPARDDDFYAPKDADIVDDSIGTSGNSHRRAEDILGAPDGRFVSLGPDGSMTINLGTKVIINGTGDDFALKSINQSTDDTDQITEDLKVSVSQDGTTFKTINPRSSDELRYDLNKAHMAWVRYIKLEDQSSTTKAKAPGTDIDAICLLNIGVQLPNRVNMTVGNQTAFATEYVTVDVTKVFDKKPSVDNCTETVTAAAPTPAPLPPPPAPVVQPAPYIPTPPPSLPKTGAEPLVLISVVSSLAWVFTRKK